MSGNFSALTPWVETMLRVWCGLALLPHGMRAFFGWFPNTGSRILNPSLLATGLERSGFRPGRYWVIYVALVEFVAGPALALGLVTPLAGGLIFLFFLGAAYDHLRFDGYFWNTLGMEYPALWGLVTLYFACAGGGAFSLDRVLFGL